jgi:hypothetical protein
MADLTQDEFLTRLEAGEETVKLDTQPRQTASTNSPGTLSEADFLARLQAGSDTTVQNRVSTGMIELPRDSFQQRHQRLDDSGQPIPLDTKSGVDTYTRTRLSFAPTEVDQVKLLQDTFQGSQIEPLGDGEYIVRGVTDPQTKQVKDVVVDEHDFDFAKDFADFAGVAPSMAVAFIALRGAGRLGLNKLESGTLLRVSAESAVAAGASSTYNALQDAGMRLSLQQPVQGGEIAKRRSMEAGGEFLLGTIGGKLLGTGAAVKEAIQAPRTAVQSSGLAAAKRLKDEFGIEVQTSWAEKTGSPLALKTEAILAKTPTGNKAVKKETAAGEKDLLDLQDLIQNKVAAGDLPPSEHLGEQAVTAIRKLEDAAKDEITAEFDQLLNRSLSNLDTAIAQETGIKREVLKSEAGGAIRTSVEAQRSKFKAAANEMYAEVGDPVIPTERIAAELESVKKELIKSKRTVTEQQLDEGFDDLGAIGDKKVVEGREVISELIPTGLRNFLSGVEKLDPEMPLSELRALRTQLNDAKSRADIFPGVSDRLLSGFSHAITEAIEQGTAKLDDPLVKTKLDAANAFYRENEPTFSVKGVIELFADPTQRKLGNFAIVNQAIRDPDQYFRVRDILMRDIRKPDGTLVSGAQKETWNLFRRAAVEDMVNRAKVHLGGNVVDGKTMLADLKGLETEVLNDIFGNVKASTILNELRTLDVLEGKINADDFTNLLGRGQRNAIEYKKLVEKQKDLDRLYYNNVIKRFTKGEVGTESLKPDDFVDRFVDVAKSRSEVEQVMGILRAADPELVQKIQGKTVQKIFQNAARNPTAEDIARGLDKDSRVIVGPQAMFKEIADNEGKYLEVLGEPTFNVLKDYLRVANMKGMKDVSASQVGGLIGGSLLSSILTLDLKNAPAHFKYWLAGNLITSPTFKRVFQAGKEVDPSTLIRAYVSSTPFIEAVFEDFGRGPGRVMMESLGRALGMLEPTPMVTGAGVDALGGAFKEPAQSE